MVSRSEAKKLCKEFAKDFFSHAVIIYVIGFVGLAIAKVIIGVMKYNSCELKPNLPDFLIVDGVVISIIILVAGTLKKKGIKINLGCFTGVWIYMLAWLIVGTAWATQVRDEIHSPDFCSSGCRKCDNLLINFTYLSCYVQVVAYGLVPIFYPVISWLGANEISCSRNDIGPEESQA